MIFNSDLPATDYNIFYGLHSAVTRTDRNGQPAGGWRREEALTIEEAIRGWTTWAAYAEFREHEIGTIASGRVANLTVLNLDPFQIGEKDPARLLTGRVVMTIVDGKVTANRYARMKRASASERVARNLPQRAARWGPAQRG